MAFDPQSVSHAMGTDRTTGLLDYYDYSTYNQSTQGHLNSNGLCGSQRHYYQMTLPSDQSRKAPRGLRQKPQVSEAAGRRPRFVRR